VEDCCDALGSKIQGYSCGKFGTVSCFSFYPAHHITTIEGGMTLTNSPSHAEAIRRFVNWGRACWCRPGQDNSCGKRHDSIVDGVPWDHKYEFVVPGGNFKPGFDIQGVIGLAQLRKEEIYRERRKRNHGIVSEYLEALGDLISTANKYGGSDPCWFGCPVGLTRFNRSEVIERLESSGVGTRLVFGGNMGRQSFLQNAYVAPMPLIKSDKVMRDWFIVGCNQTITEEEAHYIGETVRKAVTG
jgi:CDP-6-deoxy-D-xylo-4-hexulose-3-dehydrase